MSPDQIIDFAAKASAFLLVLILWCAALWIWSLRRSARTKKVEQRLSLEESETGATRVLRLWHDGEEKTTAVPDRVLRLSIPQRMKQACEKAGWDAPLHSVVLGVGGASSLVLLCTFMLTGRVLNGVGAGAVALMIFWIVLQHRISRRASIFEESLIEALDLASRSLRAGHPIGGAFRLISEEIPPPVGNLFADVCQQQTLGVSLEEALTSVAASNGTTDVKLLATSVTIQLRSGGNLADMMETLASVIRDRARTRRRARVLMAQTQLSKRMLIALPIGMFFLLSTLNPDYMAPLFNTAMGQTILAFGIGCLLLGMVVMNRMVVLRY